MRLPRDWLGPREELVPFGPRAAPPELEPDDSPPTADDFWGERAASIHDALQAPVADPPPSRWRRPAPARRRVAFGALGALLLVAFVAAWVLADQFGLAGERSDSAARARVDMAAILTGGVRQTVERGLALLDARAGSGRAAPARPRASRRIAHRRAVFTHVHETARHVSAPSVSNTQAVSADVSHATAARATMYQPTIGAGTSRPTEAVTAPPQHTSSPTASRASPSPRATVTPTGESGALGPIQSPNG